MSIVINGIKMPEAPDEVIELAILGDGTVIQTGESWRSPEDGKCYWTVTNPEKFGNAVSIPEHGRLGDLDKLENDLRHMAKYQHGERQQGILGCCETIRSEPTIIPASKEGE